MPRYQEITFIVCLYLNFCYFLIWKENCSRSNQIRIILNHFYLTVKMDPKKNDHSRSSNGNGSHGHEKVLKPLQISRSPGALLSDAVQFHSQDPTFLRGRWVLTHLFFAGVGFLLNSMVFSQSILSLLYFWKGRRACSAYECTFNCDFFKLISL